VELIKRQTTIGFSTPKNKTKTTSSNHEQMKDKVMAEVKKTFRPEFLNRIDEIIVFHELNSDQLRQIVDLMVKGLQDRLTERKLAIEISDKAKSWLVEVGYDPIYGARPLRRAIEQHVENPLSSSLLRGEFKPETTIIVDRGTEGLSFKVKKNKAVVIKNNSRQEKVAD
jgi:ATP-dependent Clp protease ATP-binding subunit ClpC